MCIGLKKIYHNAIILGAYLYNLFISIPSCCSLPYNFIFTLKILIFINELYLTPGWEECFFLFLFVFLYSAEVVFSFISSSSLDGKLVQSKRNRFPIHILNWQEGITSDNGQQSLARINKQ